MKKLIALAMLLMLVWSCAEHEGTHNSNSAPGNMASILPGGDSAGSTSASASPTPCPSLTPSPILEPRLVPAPIYGVTIEDAEDYAKDLTPVLNSLKLSQIPTVRLIFNSWKLEDEIATYQKIARSIRRDSYVMGMILDSQKVKNVDVSCYKYRTVKGGVRLIV